MAKKAAKYTDHLANERTFLAWIRTILGIMAFGFVVERFSVLMQPISSSFGRAAPATRVASSTLLNYSSLFGISLIALGAILCVFAFFRYKRTEKHINEGVYHSSLLLEAILTLFMFFSGAALIIYLILSKPK